MKISWFVVAALVGLPSTALGDPCEAPLPSRGTLVTGTVRYVGDGDGLCVGSSSNPRTWIEVRLSDFYAPELSDPGGKAAKSVLERIAKGKRVECVAGRRSYDRVVAACSVGGQPIGDLMRAAGVHEGGNGRR